MSKKKSKPCSYYSGIEPWKTKKQQKKIIDKKKEAEAFESMIRFWERKGDNNDTTN